MFESAFCQILFYVFAVLALLCAVGVVAFRNPVTSAMNMALCFGFVAAILFGMGAQFLGIVQLIVYAGAILVLFLFVVMMLDVDAGESPDCHCTCDCWLGKLCCAVRSALPQLGGALTAGMLAGLICVISVNLPGAKDGSCPCKALCDNASELCIGQPEAAPVAHEDKADCHCADCLAMQPATRFGGPLPALSPAAAAQTLNPLLSPGEAMQCTSYPDVKLLGRTLFGKYVIPFVILGFALLSGTVGAVALSRKLRKD